MNEKEYRHAWWVLPAFALFLSCIIFGALALAAVLP
jgi:hypothetical protein